MSNILFIGPYREFSGMGNASRKYIKALLLAGHNICIRPTFNTFKSYPEKDVDYEILELESNHLKSYHAVIQHCFPHQLCYDKRFEKNIGIIHLESCNYYTNINDYINSMDEIIIGSNYVYKCIPSNEKITTNIKIVPEPIDINFIEEYKTNNLKKDRSDYSFYVIADLIERKNIYDILKAYVLLYDESDNVNLVFKLKNCGNDDTNLEQLLEYEFGKIYNYIKKPSAKKPQIVFGSVDYDSILYFHNNNDCFINASCGESFGYSTLEAMLFNNQIIVNKNIGSAEIVSEKCGLMFDSSKSSCEDSFRPYEIYNTCNNFWYKPNLESLMFYMDMARNESKTDRETRIAAQKENIKKFSMDSVSQLLTDI